MAFALLSYVALAQAKVINLACEWINLRNERKPLQVSMDTDYNTASISGAFNGSGKLFSDGSAYWFTVRDGDFSTSKIQIDRNDLSLVISDKIKLSDTQNNFAGQCKISDKKAPKI